jgi:hypothetical protein
MAIAGRMGWQMPKLTPSKCHIFATVFRSKRSGNLLTSEDLKNLRAVRVPFQYANGVRVAMSSTDRTLPVSAAAPGGSAACTPVSPAATELRTHKDVDR